KAQLDRVKRYIQSAHDEGARLVAGGQSPDAAEFQKGYWMRPTVFADVEQSMLIAREEIFGPVLSVLRWNDLDEVIERANSLEYGLSGAVWTNDITTAISTAKRLQSGYIWVN